MNDHIERVKAASVMSIVLDADLRGSMHWLVLEVARLTRELSLCQRKLFDTEHERRRANNSYHIASNERDIIRDKLAKARADGLIAGFICAGGDAVEAKSQAEQLEACLSACEAKPERKEVWQYYNKNGSCSAKNATDLDCVCWHNEGTGPYPSATHGSFIGGRVMFDNEESAGLTWRFKPSTKGGQP